MSFDLSLVTLGVDGLYRAFGSNPDIGPPKEDRAPDGAIVFWALQLARLAR